MRKEDESYSERDVTRRPNERGKCKLFLTPSWTTPHHKSPLDEINEIRSGGSSRLMIAGSEPLAPRIRLRQVCIPATSEGGEGDQGDKEGGEGEGSTGWDPDGNVAGLREVYGFIGGVEANAFTYCPCPTATSVQTKDGKKAVRIYTFFLDLGHSTEEETTHDRDLSQMLTGSEEDEDS